MKINKKKKNPHQNQQQQQHHNHPHHVQDNKIEILKAAAQAWLGSHDSESDYGEFDVHRIHFQPKPSRFKLEVIKKLTAKETAPAIITSTWDFNHNSLWDPYEIVAVSKRLERGLVLDYEFSGLFVDEIDGKGKPSVARTSRKRESENSLRNLFNKLSSRKFNEPENHCTSTDIDDET
ncbi:hypothetical protein Dimus_004682 [Dionaea muscipula]